MADQSNYAALMTARAKSGAVIVGAVLTFSGCQTMATGEDIPALISDPGTDSHKALQETVNKLLHVEVALAAGALTESSMLTVQRNPPRTMQGQAATGRNMEMPLQFRLVMNGGDCILIDQRDESRHTLANTTCIAEQETTKPPD
jgi:hypothetical protein